MYSLKNKIVLITGASGGIGAACASVFAGAGTKLILAARRIDHLLNLTKNIEKNNEILVYPAFLDVCNKNSIKEFFNTLPAEWQDIDILINNAGLALGLDPLQQGHIEDWDVMIDTNIKGLLYMIRNILPGMVKKNSGHIINIGSISGHEVYPNGAVYAATKHAVNALSRALRMDLFKTKIRVSSIDPGAVETNFSNVRFKGDQARADQVYSGMTPLTPEDVADAVLYAASRPPHVNLSEMILMPTDQASISMIAREEK